MQLTKVYILNLFFIFYAGACFSQKVIPLYSDSIPNSKNIEEKEENWMDATVDSLTRNVTKPTLTAFLPPKGTATGQAVIICPGGGYHVLLTKREGSDVARAFNKKGITAFVLKYRLPSSRIMNDQSIGPLQDAQRAIMIVRKNAEKWDVDPKRIGIMGFSAGGHLAATAGTHFDKALIDNPDRISLRPDFMILIYPVISFTDSIGHIGSRDNLIGSLPADSQEKRRQTDYFSNEQQVTDRTPKTYIIHAKDDTVVPLANSEIFYKCLRAHHVPAELHIYARGEHGFLKYPAFEDWFGRCLRWLKSSAL